MILNYARIRQALAGTLLIAAVVGLPGDVRAQTASPQRIRDAASLLALSGEEYREAVRDGEIVNAQEYDEALLFLGEVRGELESLGLDPAAEDTLRTRVGTIRSRMESRMDPADVRALAADAVGILERLSGVTLVEYPEEELNLARGGRLYGRYCAHCHAESGDGRGPLASNLDPAPADFRDSTFMTVETPYDFYQVTGVGIPGTGMEGWGHVLSPRDRWEIASYIFTLRSTPAQIREGERLYRTYCDGCLDAPLDELATYGRVDDRELARMVRSAIEDGGPPEASGGAPSPTDVEIGRIVVYVRARAGGWEPPRETVDVAELARDILVPLRLTAEEYGEAVEGDSVVDAVELAEARLFLEEARDAYRRGRDGLESADPGLALEIREVLEGLAGDVEATAEPIELSSRVAGVVPRLEILAGTGASDDDAMAAAVADVRDRLDVARRHHEAGNDSAAAHAAFRAYMAFEPLEKGLRPRAPALTRSLEQGFAELRGTLQSGGDGGGESVAALDRGLRADLDRAEEELLRRGGGWGTFVQSFFIILREGFEAILIIGALAAFLAKTGAPERRSAVYRGAAWAVGASVVTAILVEWIFELAPASQEVLEGATMLLAVVMLFIVSYWLVSKIEHEKFHDYIKRKMAGAVESGGRTDLALAALAFVAVYREGFETILFYKALVGFAEGAGAGAMIAAGFAVGVVALAVIFVAFYTFGLRIPMRPFFAGTSLVLYYLALVFAGQGIRELQEAGVVSTTPLGGVPTVDWLGVYPTIETVTAQGVLVVLFLFALAWTFVIEPARRRIVEA